MPNEQDTTQVEETQVETEAAQVNGADGTTTENSETSVEENKVDPAEIERLRKEAERVAELEKERDQARMRANQLENERKEAEKAERDKLKEGGEWETLAQRLLREKEERELADAKRRDEELAEKAERERQEQVNGLRDEVLGEFPENVQALAKKLDLWWDNAENVPSAQASLREKLKELQDSLPQELGPSHHANNPLSEPDPEFREMSLDEMRKILPKADPR